MEILIVMTFAGRSEAREALEAIRRLHDDLSVDVRNVALVHRAADGTLAVPDQTEAVGVTATVSGGLVGALLGALAGPAGAVAGGIAGAAVGSALDADAAGTSDEVLAVVIGAIPRGTTAIVGDMTEVSSKPLDDVACRTGALLLRIPRADVVAKLETLQPASEAARRSSDHA